MNTINFQTHSLNHISLQVSPDELIEKLQSSKTKPAIVSCAKETLQRVNNSWDPALVYRWLPIDNTNEGETLLGEGKEKVSLHLGHSTTFVKKATYALTACYTAGDAIEKAGQKASRNQEMLAAFILDLIGLLVLEKTGNIVTELAERKAADLGWGVSPFLSPGSVHGWELDDQNQLCRLLPLENIGLQIRDDAVLVPFKSLTCLIGIGQDYTSRQVGTTCQICSKNNNCQMRQL